MNIATTPQSALVMKWKPVSMKVRTARSQASLLFSWGTSMRNLAIGHLRAIQAALRLARPSGAILPEYAQV